MQFRDPASVLARYAALVGTGHDEMLARDGSVRPHYRPLIDALGSMADGERDARHALVVRT